MRETVGSDAMPPGAMPQTGSAEQQLRQHLFDKVREEIVQAQQKNAEQFDRSVLTLSAAFLALSTSFIKDVVPLSQLTNQWLLYFSWVLFVLVICIALYGMLYAQHVQRKFLDGAERYYLRREESAHELSKVLPPGIDCVNILVGALFALAISTTVLFVIINVESAMKSSTASLSRNQTEQRAQPSNAFPKVPLQQQTGSGGQGTQQVPAAPASAQQSTSSTSK